jgi:hypothetical protein
MYLIVMLMLHFMIPSEAPELAIPLDVGDLGDFDVDSIKFDDTADIQF